MKRGLYETTGWRWVGVRGVNTQYWYDTRELVKRKRGNKFIPNKRNSEWSDPLDTPVPDTDKKVGEIKTVIPVTTFHIHTSL